MNRILLSACAVSLLFGSAAFADPDHVSLGTTVPYQEGRYFQASIYCKAREKDSQYTGGRVAMEVQVGDSAWVLIGSQWLDYTQVGKSHLFRAPIPAVMYERGGAVRVRVFERGSSLELDVKIARFTGRELLFGAGRYRSASPDQIASVFSNASPRAALLKSLEQAQPRLRQTKVELKRPSREPVLRAPELRKVPPKPRLRVIERTSQPATAGPSQPDSSSQVNTTVIK
jgi:hypothetical protein